MMTFFAETLRGKDLYRTLMNIECRLFTLSGSVLDVGGGSGQASYHRFLKNDNAKITPLDGQENAIDFEKDSLPYENNGVDTLLAFNVLEHIYNHSFLVGEMRRVLKPDGRIIGAVPFLVGYHADPKDFFRYTSEALEKIFSEEGFKDIQIKVIGRGPFSAGYSQVEFMIPRILKILFLPCVLFLDRIVFLLKPGLNKEKFALGLFFTCTK